MITDELSLQTSTKQQHNIPFKDLGDYDDLLCDLLIDGLHMGFRTHKMCSHIHSADGNAEDSTHSTNPDDLLPFDEWFASQNRQDLSKAVLKVIQENVMVNGNISKASELVMQFLTTGDLRISKEKKQPVADKQVATEQVTEKNAAEAEVAIEQVISVEKQTTQEKLVSEDTIVDVVGETCEVQEKVEISVNETSANSDGKSEECDEKSKVPVEGTPSEEGMEKMEKSACPALSRYQKFLSEKTPEQLKDFRSHMEKYISMYHPNAGYEIARTYRYTTSEKVEACLVSTKYWKKGDQMKFCVGTTTALTDHEEAMLDKRDFSLIYSTRNRHTNLFLGPARFANHDCRPNVQFMPNENGSTICFRVIEEIAIGQEICVMYGENYFGDNNTECLCATCEETGKGAFLDLTKAFSSPVRRTAARNKKAFNYYDDDLYNININVINTPQPVPSKSRRKSKAEKSPHQEEEQICKCCTSPLKPDTEDTKFLDASWFNSRVKGNKIPVCPRCYRHFALFACVWPQRKSTLLKNCMKMGIEWNVDSFDAQILGEVEDGEYVFDNEDHASNGFVNFPGSPAPDFLSPHLVWVYPNDGSSTDIWWPGIIIPQKYCAMEKTLKKLAEFAVAEGDKAVILYLEYPSIGYCELTETRLFSLNAEPYFRFLNQDPALVIGDLKQSESINKGVIAGMENLQNLSRGILPSGARWKAFIPVLKSVLTDFPQIFGGGDEILGGDEKPAAAIKSADVDIKNMLDLGKRRKAVPITTAPPAKRKSTNNKDNSTLPPKKRRIEAINGGKKKVSEIGVGPSSEIIPEPAPSSTISGTFTKSLPEPTVNTIIEQPKSMNGLNLPTDKISTKNRESHENPQSLSPKTEDKSTRIPLSATNNKLLPLSSPLFPPPTDSPDSGRRHAKKAKWLGYTPNPVGSSPLGMIDHRQINTPMEKGGMKRLQSEFEECDGKTWLD